MADASNENLLKTWLAHMQELTKSAEPMEETAQERSRRQSLFAKLLGLTDATADGARSRMLDSAEMQSLHAVDHLTKKPDGTTVVRVYFPNDATEVNGICGSDALVHPECTPLKDDRIKALAREAMKAIVGESGAKIEFQEVLSRDSADIAFVKSSGAIAVGDKGLDGYSGRARDINYVIDGMGGSNFRQLMQKVFNELPPEEQEKKRKLILQTYADKYGKDADLFTILTSEREKMVIAHEIEHTLGAQHPDAAAGTQLTRQTIMADPVLATGQGGELGKVLEGLDVEWYQRHFGVKDLPENTPLSPSSIGTGKPGGSPER